MFLEKLDLNLKDISVSSWLIIIIVASLIFSLFILQLVLLVLIIIYLLECIKNKKIFYFKTNLDFALFIFILVRIFSILFSSNIQVSTQYLYKEIVFYSTFFLFTYYLSNSEENFIILLLKILILAGVISSLYGTGKVLFGIVERAESSTSGYFTLGTFLTVVYAIAINLGTNKKIFPSRTTWVISLVFLLIGVLFTYDRTHWGIVALITLIVGITKERLLLVSLFSISIITVIVIPSLTDRFIQMIHFSQNLSDRNVIWSGAKQLLFEKPFTGFGIGTFREIFPLLDQLKDKGVGSWHSDYLQMYFESGLFGLGTFLFLMFTIFKTGFQSLKKQIISVNQKDILISVLFGISTLYLSAFLSGFILSPINSILFFFLIAIVGVISKKNLKKILL